MTSDLTTHIGNFRRHLDKAGLSGSVEYFSKLYHRKMISVPTVNIYERSWDVLVVLDACRVDTLAELAPEYEFLSNQDEIWSVGSSSGEWMRNTFTDEYQTEVSETSYITGNPFSEKQLVEVKFNSLIEAWRYEWDNEIGTMPPRPLTDIAIREMRERSPSRMVIHYMQPHFPCFPDPLDKTPLGIELERATERTWGIWDEVQTGGINKKTAYQQYKKNLKYILKEIRILLNNISAQRVVITSDHGNAFGERYLWGHPAGVKHKTIRKVPWYITNAVDERTYEPEDLDFSTIDVSTEDRLADLGYK